MNFYIHVPFCLKKCNYCAFYSRCDAPDWENYTREVLEQLDWFAERTTSREPRATIFFGGGTPSLMPVKYAERIVGKIKNINDLQSKSSSPREFSLEANPKTLDTNKLKDWKDLGLTRLSVGMQSFDDDELQFLGRIHTAKEALDLIDAGRACDLRVSADFIYGLPNQSAADVADICEKINALPIEHASLYELTIEPGAKFAAMTPTAESVAAEMYRAIHNTLRLPRYEVSNYGRPCLHNAAVWSGEPYIGVGESAAGRVCDSSGWIETKIINGKVVANRLTESERAAEIIMTALRTIKGVPLPRRLRRRPFAGERGKGLREYINWPFVRSRPEYFVIGPETLAMTESGIMLLDSLLPDVIL